MTKKLSKEFSKTESRILGALSKLDEYLLNPQVRTCSVAVQGTSGNANSGNRETPGDRSSNDPYPEVGCFPHHSGQLNSPETETYPHMVTENYPHNSIISKSSPHKRISRLLAHLNFFKITSQIHVTMLVILRYIQYQVHRVVIFDSKLPCKENSSKICSHSCKKDSQNSSM